MNLDIVNFCQQLPKVELHAHANGSLRDETISKLLNGNKNLDLDIGPYSVIIRKGEQRTMSEGFEMFKIIHKLVNSTEIVYECVQEVIADFAAEGVKYLELRSTPRDVASTGMTKRSYMDTVIKAMKTFMNNDNKSNIIVRYLPSIDRKLGIENAYEVIKLAEEYMLSDGNVVGIDFSGNPFINNGKDFFDPLFYAKKANLKLAIHMAEIGVCKKETEMLLQLPPDRIGHGTFLCKDEKLSVKVLKEKIPLEICMSSNIKTGTAPLDYTKHHLLWWKCKNNHPCVLGTDDKGVFSTTLSNEYTIAANALQLNNQQLFEWSKSSIDYIFDNQQIKNDLKDFWTKKHKDIFSV